MTKEEKVALIKTILINADKVEKEIYPYILREIEEATTIKPIEGTTYKGGFCVSEMAYGAAQDYIAELCEVPYELIENPKDNLASLLVQVMMGQPVKVYNADEEPIWEFTVRLHEDWRIRLEALIEILTEQN